VGAYSPERRPWERINSQHTLQSFKNTFLNINLDQNMLKNALFFKKSWKNRRSVGGGAP